MTPLNHKHNKTIINKTVKMLDYLLFFKVLSVIYAKIN